METETRNRTSAKCSNGPTTTATATATATARRRGQREPDIRGQPQGVRLAGDPRRREPRDLRQVLDLCRPRLRGEEAGRFPHPQGRRPAGDLLPRPQGRGPRAVQHLPPPRRDGLPRARGQRAAVSLHLSRLDLQQRRLAGGRAGRRRLSAGLRQAGQGPDAGAAVRALQGLLFRQPRPRRASICTTISPAPRNTSTSSSTSRRPARWRSSPACRNTTSRRTGSCWSRTASTTITCVTTHSTWLNYMGNSGVKIKPPKGARAADQGLRQGPRQRPLTTDNPTSAAGRWRGGFRSTAKRPRPRSTRSAPNWSTRLGEARARRASPTPTAIW